MVFLSFDGEEFEVAASTECDHKNTYGLANYRGMALSSGSASDSACSARTELYDYESDQWNDAPNYPFES